MMQKDRIRAKIKDACFEKVLSASLCCSQDHQHGGASWQPADKGAREAFEQ